jgi:hypothetical protein
MPWIGYANTRCISSATQSQMASKSTSPPFVHLNHLQLVPAHATNHCSGTIWTAISNINPPPPELLLCCGGEVGEGSKCTVHWCTNHTLKQQGAVPPHFDSGGGFIDPECHVDKFCWTPYENLCCTKFRDGMAHFVVRDRDTIALILPNKGSPMYVEASN